MCWLMSTYYAAVRVMFGMSLCTEIIFLPLKFPEIFIMFLIWFEGCSLSYTKDAPQKACRTSGCYCTSHFEYEVVSEYVGL